MATDERRLESLAIEWIIQQVRARRRMKDTLPIEGAMTVPLEWAESLANVYEGVATEDARPPYDDLAAVVRALATTEDIYKAVYPRGFIGGLPHYYCVICDAGIRGEHAPDCLVSRARALAARLPPDGTQLP
jgi:hypothetical protein